MEAPDVIQERESYNLFASVATLLVHTFIVLNDKDQ